MEVRVSVFTTRAGSQHCWGVRATQRADVQRDHVEINRYRDDGDNNAVCGKLYVLAPSHSKISEDGLCACITHAILQATNQPRWPDFCVYNALVQPSLGRLCCLVIIIAKSWKILKSVK